MFLTSKKWEWEILSHTYALAYDPLHTMPLISISSSGILVRPFARTIAPARLVMSIVFNVYFVKDLHVKRVEKVSLVFRRI
jgi:hypothetical protein